MTVTPTTRVADEASLMDQVKRALDRNQPDRALAMINSVGYQSARVRNARAVCLLRTGQVEPAKHLLRELVFPGQALTISRETPTVYRTNYVTALLLAGDVITARSLLYAIPDRGHPAVRRLEHAIRQWRAAIPWWRRWLLIVGIMPDHPVVLPTPGDLDVTEAEVDASGATA